MLGSINWKSQSAVVVGGGFSGLLCAYFLQKHGVRVTLFEAQSKVGGLIYTHHTECGIAETAAHSLLLTKPVHEFFEEIGIDYLPVGPKSKARFILRSDFSKHPIRRIPIQALRAKEWMELLFRAKKKLPKTSLASHGIGESAGTNATTIETWALTHLGAYALRYLVNPFLAGIYAADASELLVDLVFPDWKIEAGQSLFGKLRQTAKARKQTAAPRDHKKTMVAPRAGMSSVIKKLEKKLQESGRVEIVTKRFEPDDAKNISSDTQIFLCTEASAAAPFLEIKNPQIASALRQVPYAPLISVTLFLPVEGFGNSYWKGPPVGVGILNSRNPKSSSDATLGVLFNSSAFENRVSDSSVCSFTVMLGGTLYPRVIDWSDEQIITELKKELPKFFGLHQLPEIADLVITRWPKAIPVYGPALQQALETGKSLAALEAASPFVLFGNYTGQISLRGMIETWKKLEDQMSGRSLAHG